MDTTARASLSLCVLVHICLSYLFPVLCFLGNKRKDYIIETLNSNSCFSILVALALKRSP